MASPPLATAMRIVSLTHRSKELDSDTRKKVVYLIGAGASHGCVKRASSQYGILMRDLTQSLDEKLNQVVMDEYRSESALMDLLNSVISDDSDFEQIITFLDDSPSKIHRQFADKMRTVFQEVLVERLELIRNELGEDPVGLYAALFDMYEVPGCTESLLGIMTLNYDEYIERAAEKISGGAVDFGFRMRGTQQTQKAHRLLKLHGSFGWEDTWPTTVGNSGHPLWIPPGIQKAKQAYPFNVLWGLAREMLSCDVLRIIGCRLGPNDWDLISLLFTTRHVGNEYSPYTIEIIDSLKNAERLKNDFPYLDVRSIFDIDEIGPQIIGELTGDAPKDFGDLTEDEKALLRNDTSSSNWFAIWLEQMAEVMTADLGSISTESGLFESLLQRT